MAKHKRLLSVGTPVKLANLRLALDSIDTDSPNECIVRHMNGQLIIEEPRAGELALEEGAEA